MAQDLQSSTARKPLPKGWRWVRFGDVADNVNATEKNPLTAGLTRFVGLEHLEPNDLRVRSWGNVADGTTFNRVFRAGQVLFGKRRVYQRKAALADFDGICSGDIYVFAANDGVLIPELLPFLVQTEGFFKHAESTSEGSLSPRTKWKYLAEYEFALPSEPAQQHRIAELLQGIEGTIECWLAVRDSAYTLAESLLIERIGNYFTHNDGSKDGTVLIPLADRYEIQLGKRLAPETKENGQPKQYLRNANVDWYSIDCTDLLTMCFTEKEFEKYRLKVGDILACEGRHTGKSAIWYGTRTDLCYQMSLHRLRRRILTDVPEYLLHHMRYFHLTGQFNVDTLTTTIPHLSAERLSQIEFAFPTPQQQQRIVDEVRSVRSLAMDAQSHLERMRTIKSQSFGHLLTPPTEAP